MLPVRLPVPPRRSLFPAAGLLGVLLAAAPAPALAGTCGDDVGGTRVPCACGDFVVSDTVLWNTDPVVAAPCRRDGLVVFAPADADGITLDLGGQAIVGSGKGVGIRIVRGGREGATILGGEDGRAQVARFATGIHASGRSLVKLVRGLDLLANGDDGLDLRSSGAVIEDVKAEGNGRDGVRLRGHGLEARGVEAARNMDDGVEVRGAGARVEARSIDNAGNGAVVAGRGNRVESIESSGNGGAGVLATGGGHSLGSAAVEDNERGAVAGREGAVR